MSIRRATANCAAAILASALLTGCVKGPHFDEGGLATALSWLDIHDEKTIVSDVRLWAYGPEAGRQAAASQAVPSASTSQTASASQTVGSLSADLHFSSAADLAATLIPLEEGRYTVLGAANLTAPFSCIGTAEDIEFTLDHAAYNAASQSSIATPSEAASRNAAASRSETAAGQNAVPTSEVSATQPSATLTAGPAHAFYGVTQVNINDRAKITVAPVAIRRVLSELTIIIEDAPQGAKLSGEVLDAAASLFPLRQDADGNYGLASERTMTVTIPEAQQTAATTRTATIRTALAPTPASAKLLDPTVPPASAKLLAATSTETLVSPTLRLMPTASSREFSHLRILLTTPEGEQFEFRIEAPLMRPSGKYVVNLKYDQMRPYMRLSVHNINDWTEGWIYNGEILDPTAASALTSTSASSASAVSAAGQVPGISAAALAPTVASAELLAATVASAAIPTSAELLAATPTPAPVRTKSIPCVKSRLVRTGAEENYPRAHEAAWCAQNSSRAHGTLATPHGTLATPHGTLATPHVTLATPHDNRVAVQSSQAPHGNWSADEWSQASHGNDSVAAWSQEPHGNRSGS